MILVGLGEAGKNIATLFKPHSKNYKIIILDENNGIDKKIPLNNMTKSQSNLNREGSNLTMKPFCLFVGVVR